MSGVFFNASRWGWIGTTALLGGATACGGAAGNDVQSPETIPTITIPPPVSLESQPEAVQKRVELPDLIKEIQSAGRNAERLVENVYQLGVRTQLQAHRKIASDFSKPPTSRMRAARRALAIFASTNLTRIYIEGSLKRTKRVQRMLARYPIATDHQKRTVADVRAKLELQQVRLETAFYQLWLETRKAVDAYNGIPNKEFPLHFRAPSPLENPLQP